MQYELEELLKQLEEARRQTGAKGFTTGEIVELTGWSAKKVREALRLGQKAGRIKCTGRRYEAGIDGVYRPTPVYDLVKEKEGEAS